MFALLARYASEELDCDEAAKSIPVLEQGAVHSRGAALPEDLEEATPSTLLRLGQDGVAQQVAA